MAIPGATADDVQGAILDHCENVFLQDRFAILDGKQTATLTKAAIQGTGVRDSSYGAIYYPWIDVGEKDDDNKAVFVPPSGHIAGVYARVDAERGVHKAPANEVIRGALGVEALLSREDQAGLNPEDINVIRKFDGNITIWGAHTLAGKENAEWRYVNVRRLFNFMRESIDEGTQWVVFEPNSADLWSKIRRNVSAFLTNVWASGAVEPGGHRHLVSQAQRSAGLERAGTVASTAHVAARSLNTADHTAPIRPGAASFRCVTATAITAASSPPRSSRTAAATALPLMPPPTARPCNRHGGAHPAGGPQAVDRSRDTARVGNGRAERRRTPGGKAGSDSRHGRRGRCRTLAVRSFSRCLPHA